MERIVSIIHEIHRSLNSYLESLDDMSEIDCLEKKQGLDVACATLEWRFRMLSHCVAILTLLSKTRPQRTDKAIA